MKKNIIACLLVELFFSNVNAQLTLQGITKGEAIQAKQEITLTSTTPAQVLSYADAQIETTQRLIFSQANINLDNVTFKANKIRFDAAVVTVTASHQVRFECDELEITNSGTPLMFINSGEAEVTIIYHKLVNSTRITNIPSPNGYSFMLKFEKK